MEYIKKMMFVGFFVVCVGDVNAEENDGFILNAEGLVDLFTGERFKGLGEKKLWWERMVRGEVGKHRFYILCALKNGEWTRLDDVRNYIDFKSTVPGTYSTASLMTMFEFMRAQRVPKTPYYKPKLKTNGEGWLQKSHDTEPYGVNTKWRIHPEVLPFLYLLLLGCPDDNTCEVE